MMMMMMMRRRRRRRRRMDEMVVRGEMHQRERKGRWSVLTDGIVRSAERG